MLSCQQRREKIWIANAAGGRDGATKRADVARAAFAFAGFDKVRVPNSVDVAKALYKAVIPAGLQHNEDQWNHSSYQAMAAMLNNAPSDEAELAMVVHKRNPATGLTGQKWRITLPPASANEPAWFETARVARAAVRAHALQNKDAIMAALMKADKDSNPKAVLMTDEELEEYEEVAEREPPPSSDNDSGDAAKENAGVGRRANAAASKPKAPPAKATKKRAASARAAADDDSADDAPKPKRKVIKAAEDAADHAFFAAVQAVADHLEDKDQLIMRWLIASLGLSLPGAENLERRKLMGDYVKALAGSSGDAKMMAAQLINALRDEARFKGIPLKPPKKKSDAAAAAAAETSDGAAAAAEPEAAAA